MLTASVNNCRHTWHWLMDGCCSTIVATDTKMDWRFVYVISLITNKLVGIWGGAVSRQDSSFMGSLKIKPLGVMIDLLLHVTVKVRKSPPRVILWSDNVNSSVVCRPINTSHPVDTLKGNSPKSKFTSFTFECSVLKNSIMHWNPTGVNLLQMLLCSCLVVCGKIINDLH